MGMSMTKTTNYVNVKTNTSTMYRQGNHTWPFKGVPSLPFKRMGSIWHEGWDIPTRWAIDNKSQCWIDNGHGHPLEKCNASVIEELTK